MRMQVQLLLFLLVIRISTSLRCIQNCEQTFNISESFNGFGDRCGRPVENADRCYVKIQFLFYLDQVTTLFDTDRLPDRDFIHIEPNSTKYFFYQIEHGCDNFDDCAGVFAEKKMTEMKEKAYNVSYILDDVDNLLGSTDTSKGLICYDGNRTTDNCSRLDKLCYVKHDQINNETDAAACPRGFDYFPVNIVVRDQGNSAGLFFRYSQHLCNTIDTMNKVKNILFKYNITDKNGRTRSWSTNMGITSIGVSFHIVLAFLLICVINSM